MSPAGKICPICRLAAPLDAQQCVGCGHVYRTQNFGNATTTFIAPTANPAQPSNQQVPATAAQQFVPIYSQPTFEWWMKSTWCLIGIGGGIFGLYSGLRIAVSDGGSAVLVFLFVYGLLAPFWWVFVIGGLGLVSSCSLWLHRLLRSQPTSRLIPASILISIILGWFIFASERAIRALDAPKNPETSAAEEEQILPRLSAMRREVREGMNHSQVERALGRRLREEASSRYSGISYAWLYSASDGMLIIHFNDRHRVAYIEAVEAAL